MSLSAVPRSFVLQNGRQSCLFLSFRSSHDDSLFPFAGAALLQFPFSIELLNALFAIHFAPLAFESFLLLNDV